jgi:steroid delta-isomerase-like uncharacterized protein
MNGRNLDLMDQFIAPNFVHGTFPNTNGPAGFKQALQGFITGFPDMKVNMEHIAADGDHVATRGTMTGTNTGTFMGMPATNKQIKIDYIDWWQFENGKCTKNWVQMDMPAMMTQLGVMPGTAAAH